MEVKILDEKNRINSIKLNQSITGYDLLQKYYQSKDKSQIVAFFLNDKVHDLFAKISNDATVKFIFQKDVEGWKTLNYGCALVLAYAIKKVYPEAIIALANNNDYGFYLDFDYKKQLKQEDLQQLSFEMNKILNTNFPITRGCQDLTTTLDIYQDNPYAQEYAKLNLNQLTNQVCSYLINNKVRVIASSVAAYPSQLIKHFQLTSITGAYWLGNEKNKQLQRISGIADWTKEQLVAKMHEITVRRNQDHRFLGKKLNIFMFNDDVGRGLPMFLPNGMTIKKVIQEYLWEQEFKWDYQEVATPVLGSVELYKKSGHWDHYRENMFSPIVKDNEQLVLRPMTCPHHCMIYQSIPHSYRDLPIRMSEHALLYRYEASGALTGLERVRSMELTDSHIFVRPDQMKEEFKRCYHLIADVLKTFNIKIDYLSLSLRDPKDNEKYFPDNEMWDKAEQALREVLDELKLKYQEMVGEAAFYGPKFDVQIKTALGHEITISTIQFDFLLPKRFNLTYIDNQNQEKHPVIVHRGIIGTYERFIATLLEQTQGVFPLWLAPKQLVILPINDSEEVIGYSSMIQQAFKAKNIRTSIIVNETLGKRIKTAHEEKIPYIVVIGKKELNNKKITYHTYQDQKHDLVVTKDVLLKKMVKEIAGKK
ncbi:MAG: threonine--tRNA ligase [Spiroplasma sp.]|nr:threonine--tRNA ligase [Spiroplasma sp.]